MVTALLAIICAAQSDEIAEAAKKTADFRNYTFKITVQRAGGGGGGSPQPVEGKVDGDQPVYLKANRLEAYKKDTKLVTKNQEGSWAEVEPPQKGAEKEKGNRGGQILRGVKAPHEELGGLETAFQELTKAGEKENDCAVYSGTLSEEGAKRFAGRGRGKMSFSGSAKIWVNAEGVIVKYEIVTQVKGENDRGPVDLTTTRTVELVEIGTTKVEVPDDVKKFFE
jgi:hypothetical protein